MAEHARAKVDREKCFSYAVCIEMLPEVFQLDDADISVPRPGVTSSLASLINAAEECPMQAISVLALDGMEIYPGR